MEKATLCEILDDLHGQGFTEHVWKINNSWYHSSGIMKHVIEELYITWYDEADDKRVQINKIYSENILGVYIS